MQLALDYPAEPAGRAIGPRAVFLVGFARSPEREVLAAIASIEARAPFRHMITPGGFRMSVAMTNCGSLGWMSDRSGYRYTDTDPESGEPWPALPTALVELARDAAAKAGFEGFEPDACLVNRYEPGARLTLHQDKNELDFEAPIVSVSLGLGAVFLWGGGARSDPQQRIPLAHGDVVVWGGPDRLRYHGVAPVRDGHHPILGRSRINLTFRKAGE